MTKLISGDIIILEKGKTSTVMPQFNYLIIAVPVQEGGYCAFMGNSIIKTNTIKSAMSNFFAISTMLTFHKHTPFHRLGIATCEYKSMGITAGVNTVKKSYL